MIYKFEQQSDFCENKSIEFSIKGKKLNIKSIALQPKDVPNAIALEIEFSLSEDNLFELIGSLLRIQSKIRGDNNG